MSHTRAERRHHRDRLIVKRFKEEHRRSWFMRDENTEERRSENLRRAKLRTNTAKPCSCWMCCNPRKNAGNSAAGKTWQEVRAQLNQNDPEE